MHPRIVDVTPRAQPGRAIEVPKGAGVTPLIPWPQVALTPSFSLNSPSNWLTDPGFGSIWMISWTRLEART